MARVQSNQAYLNEVRKRGKIEEELAPAFEEYYASIRDKLRPKVETSVAKNESEMRDQVITQLSKILKPAAVSYVVEALGKANDIPAFYSFAPAFLGSLKGAHDLDAQYLLQLWSRFKSNISFADAQAPPITGTTMTAAEYAKKIKPYFERKMLESQERHDMSQQDIPVPLKYKQRTPKSIMIPEDELKYRSPHETDYFLGKHYPPHTKLGNALEVVPYGYRRISKHGGYSKTPRKNPVRNRKGKGLTLDHNLNPTNYSGDFRPPHIGRR